MDNQITQLLNAAGEGDPDAFNQLFLLIYDELRRLAKGLFVNERKDHTLQPTAVVNEVYLKLVGTNLNFENRKHFFRIAASAMRNLLIDHARGHGREKRGSGEKFSLEDTAFAGLSAPQELVALDAALKELAEVDEQQSRVVELRYFVGLTIEETAEVLDISPATVKREWAMARAWLQRALETT